MSEFTKVLCEKIIKRRKSIGHQDQDSKLHAQLADLQPTVLFLQFYAIRHNKRLAFGLGHFHYHSGSMYYKFQGIILLK